MHEGGYIGWTARICWIRLLSVYCFMCELISMYCTMLYFLYRRCFRIILVRAYNAAAVAPRKPSPSIHASHSAFNRSVASNCTQWPTSSSTIFAPGTYFSTFGLFDAAEPAASRKAAIHSAGLRIV